jgi:hypothetical protein
MSCIKSVRISSRQSGPDSGAPWLELGTARASADCPNFSYLAFIFTPSLSDAIIWEPPHRFKPRAPRPLFHPIGTCAPEPLNSFPS